MMANGVSLRILIPEGTTNYVKNPSFRYDTTGWTAVGATLTRSLARARFGVASGKIVTNGAALNEGALYRVSALDGISDDVTVSVYLRGEGVVRLRLDDNSAGGGEYISEAIQLTNTRWVRASVTGRCHGGDDLRLVVETAATGPIARTFYVDGAQMERKPYPTTYCDGDQERCTWNGIYHNSASLRPDGTRAGGYWFELSGPAREAEDLYMTNAGGMGMPAIGNNIQKYALAPGSYHQGTSVESRVITLLFHARHKILFRAAAVNLDKLHALRQLLIDTIKPDRTAGDEDILFEYQDGNVPLYFRARYDGGLEGDWDVRNANVNSFPLRLLAVDPFYEEDSQEAQELDFQDTINPSYVMGRVDGQWGILNYGVDDISYRLALGSRNEVYLAGLFVTVNNNAAAIDPLLSSEKISYWDGEQWQMGCNGVFPGSPNWIQAFDVAPTGYIYVGGNVVSIPPILNNAIYWDGSAWHNMGAGLNNITYQVKADRIGNIYYAGAFTVADTLACYRVARWDGSQWHRMGQFGGLNDQVDYMVVSPDDKTIVVAGKFTDQEGFAANALYHIAQYDTDSGQFSAMGGNATDLINGPLLYTRTGVVYAWGFPETLNGKTVYNLARWSGSAWENLGGALSVEPNAMYEMPDGTVVLAGGFSKIGNTPASRVALWNGSNIVPMDIRAPEALPQDVRVLESGDIYIADYSNNGDAVQTAHVNTVNNPGSMACKPVFYVSGPGRLAWIENQTSGARLYLDLLVFENEEVMIDTVTGRIGSILRPNLLDGLLGGSDFMNFRLVPGENKIGCFMHDDVNAKMSMQFSVKHWSADAGGDGTQL